MKNIAWAPGLTVLSFKNSYDAQLLKHDTYSLQRHCKLLESFWDQSSLGEWGAFTGWVCERNWWINRAL